MLTGEYFVLAGASALAVPTVFGQKMEVRVSSDRQSRIYWRSYDRVQSLWFEAEFSQNLEVITSSSPNKAQYIAAFLKIIAHHKPNKFKNRLEVVTFLEFPLDWGLGSSATLMSNLARWAAIDPYLFLDVMKGSGYDLACARSDVPILFDMHRKAVPKPSFKPDFEDSIFFIHLNQKVNSRASVSQYFRDKEFPREDIDRVSRWSGQMLEARDLDTFSRIIEEHAIFISDKLQIPTVKQCFFEDYPYAIKYLGAWGGDFCLAVMPSPDWKSYFIDRGYHTIVGYRQMVYAERC